MGFPLDNLFPTPHRTTTLLYYNVRQRRVDQQKIAEQLKIRVHIKLVREIAAYDAQHPAAGDHLTHITTTQGAAFSVKAFGNLFREACAAAGL